ncbi:multidrug effflux MFS transporter [Leeuwenhoekiella sp. A16]|uniref:multidrug effflux MFS transporter n=1 Tax=unclassified Leeuwenhoekiella TaxID=2615029 RepID=UPI003A800CB1
MTHRYTTKSKNVIVLVLGTLIAIGPFSIDMYLPGFASVAEEFDVDISRVGLTLTSYFIGIALGQLAYGPLMDRYGRRKPLIVGLSLYIISALIAAFSWNLYVLIITRFFMALGASSGMVASKAMVRDLFDKKQVADVLSTLMLIMGVAPIIAPTVGGIVIGFFNWEAVFFILASFAAIMLFNVTFILPESVKPNRSTSLHPKAVVLEYISILKNREFFIFSMARGFTIGALLAYVSSAPFLFIEYFGMSEQHFGWIFGGNAFGLILGSQLNRLVLRRFSLLKITLTTTILLTIVTVVGLISNLIAVEFWVVYPVLFLMLFLIGFQNPNVTTLALHPFTVQAGSASALVGSLSMIFGSLASILVTRFVTVSIVPLFYIVFGCSIFSFILVLIYNRKPVYISYEA